MYGILVSFLILWGGGVKKKIGLNPKATKLKKKERAGIGIISMSPYICSNKYG